MRKAFVSKELVNRWTLFSAFAVLLSFQMISLRAFAGECKVSRPSDDVLADAKTMSDVNERSLIEITAEYERETGKRLEIVIVARAGQDLRDQVVLKDIEGRSPLTLANIYEAASRDPDSFPMLESGKSNSPEYEMMKNVIQKKFRDPNRSMEFSHIGFMIRNHPRAPKPAPGEAKMWRARHMLRPCENKNPKTDFEKIQQRDLNVPYLWDEGSFNFFADNPYELKARYYVPSPALQARLMEAVFDQELIYKLNSRYYNAAANWQNVNESNSNQWVLEVLAAATRPKSQVQTREDAQAVLAKMNYTPTKVLFKGQKTMAYMPIIARKIAPYLTYHASEQPYYFKASMGEVISAGSVEEFMQKNGLLFRSYVTETFDKTEDLRAASKQANQLIPESLRPN